MISQKITNEEVRRRVDYTMQAEHHTTDHEQKTAHGAMDGWICRPRWYSLHYLSMGKCTCYHVCKSARARVYVWFVHVAYVYIIYYNRPTILLTQKNLSFPTCSINNTVKLFIIRG